MIAEQSLTQLGQHNASALHFKGTGLPVHFYHANGFGADAYLPFLRYLAPHHRVSALNMRPLWANPPNPNRKHGWRQYADDLINWLDATQTGPIIGIGHSMGAVSTAYAANKRPDLFQALVLIEPPGTSRGISTVLRTVPYRLRGRLGPIRAAMRSRDTWQTHDEIFDEFRGIAAYKRFDDATLRHLIDATTKETDAGVTLSYPVEWETHNYLQAPHSLPDLARLTVPTHVIAAKPSFFCSPQIMAKLQQKRPDIGFSHFPKHGHLMPLEAPEDTAKATLAALSTLL